MIVCNCNKTVLRVSSAIVPLNTSRAELLPSSRCVAGSPEHVKGRRQSLTLWKPALSSHNSRYVEIKEPFVIICGTSQRALAHTNKPYDGRTPCVWPILGVPLTLWKAPLRSHNTHCMKTKSSLANLPPCIG